MSRWRASSAAFCVAGILTMLSTDGALADGPGTNGPHCSLAIFGTTVIDGTGSEPLADRTVLVAGERIVAIGEADSVDTASCTVHIDGRGHFLLPGFIDTNVHMAMLRDPIDFARYFDQLYDIVIEGAQLHLKFGVTSIRDSYGVLAPLLAARDAIRQGDAIGADIYVAGNILGWGGQFSATFRGRPPENFFEEWINEQFTRGGGELLMWMSPEELRSAVNDYIDLGVDFVKIGVTDHDQNSPRLMFSQRQLNAIVETVHERGLMVEVHATSPEGMVMSLDAGVDLIQHPEVIGVPITQEVLARLDGQEAICSIHGNNHAGRAWAAAQGDVAGEETGSDESDKPTVLRDWPTPETTEASRQRELVEANSQNFRDNAKKILQTNCILTTATDNNMGRPPEFIREPNKWHAREPGLGTLATIESLVELGRTPSDAIVAATRNGAVALQREDDLGTVEVGKIADLLLLEANPLSDISNVRKLKLVMKRGVVIDRDALPVNPIFYGPGKTQSKNVE